VGESNGTSRQSMSEIEKLRADNTHLRAALDAAEANINLKADWIDATINDMAQVEQDAAEARAVGVKPLEWVENPDLGEGGFLGGGVTNATYHAMDDGWSFHRAMFWRKAPSLELAQAAAQAHYDAAILSALHSASPLGAVALDSFDQLIAEAKAEATRAMTKFPQPNYVISKVAEEAGEVVKAAIHCAEGRETPENVIGEIRQTIAMLYRLWVEGDQVHGLAALAPFARKGE